MGSNVRDLVLIRKKSLLYYYFSTEDEGLRFA